MISLNFLYRGESLASHESNDGHLIAKGNSFSRSMRIGEPMALIGNGFTIGESNINAAISHQHDSNSYPTSGISTTPIYKRALYYATNNGTQDGVIYIISRDLLSANSVSEFVVSDIMNSPKIPEDQEVILVPSDKELPACVVIDVIRVQSSDIS